MVQDNINMNADTPEAGPKAAEPAAKPRKTRKKAEPKPAQDAEPKAAEPEAGAKVHMQEPKPAEPEKPIVPKEVDLNTYITVYNGFQGGLVYKSRRTGETFKWDRYGSEQEMELKELKNAKNTHKQMFINNWFMFSKEDSWVIDYLGLNQYYKNAVSIDEFDNIFKLSPAKLKAAIGEMSKAQQKSVLYRASRLIESGEIDSRKTIAALEEALGVQLIE